MNENFEYEPLTFDEILEDREYQAEFDRRVQKAISTAKSKWANAQLGIKDATDNETILSLQDEISDLKQTIIDRDNRAAAEKRDKALNRKINDAIKDKKFTNDYTKDAIVSQIKDALNNGSDKSVNDILKELTENKTGIFMNPNQPGEIPGTSANIFASVDKEAFSKMGYQDRVNLKAENPDLFAQLNSQ